MNEQVDVNNNVSDDEWLNTKLDSEDENSDVWLNNKLNEEDVQQAITNKVATISEPDTSYIKKVDKFLQDMSYYSNEIKTGAYRGGALAITSTAKFVADVTGSTDSKEWLDDADGYLNKLLDTSSQVGEVSETVGRVGVGLFATGGLGVSTIPARMAQGFAIDLLAFEGKSGNIADVFDEYDIPLGGVVDALKTDMSDTELESRLKNAFGGALVGGALETVVAGFRFGKDLIKSNSIKLEGDDAKVISTVINTMKEEANNLNTLKKDLKIDETASLTKAQFNEGEVIFNRATEMIKDIPDNFDELVSKGQTAIKTDVFKIPTKLEGEAGVPYAERVLKENNISTIDEKKFWDIKSNSNTTEEALSKFDKYMKSKEFRTPEDYKTIDFQYHGTSNEITTLKNGNVTDTNIYGDGFYTTNKAEIASSYTKKGSGTTPTVYKVEEIKPINNLDLDSTKIDNNIFNFESLGVGITKDDSIRGAIDKFRNESGLPKYEVTDTIDSIQQAYSKQGFNSWSHKGGEATNSAGHNVKIYFNPKEDIKITKVTPEEIKANTEAFNKARNAIKTNKTTIDATLNLKQPLNTEKITPTNAETLAKATQDIEADATFESHKDLLKRADKDLQNKLGQEGYDLVKDLTDTADVVSNLSLKVTQARVVVGNLTDKYQQALEVAKKENTSESMVRAMLSLDNLVMVSRTLKNTTSSVAKAMSAMRINTESSNLFNSLKILDNIDSDYSMSLLRDAFSKNNADEVFKIMENFSDASKKMKDHIDNYQDGAFKKVGNVLSEGMIASMLSSASTLAINVVGNSFVKHQRLLQDTLQFIYGQAMKSSDRMKAREFRYLMGANIIPNGKTVSIIGKNISDWAKSGFKDETFDEAVLARYVQDQEHQHKYISSQYIRGLETGNVNSTVNNMINTYGKLARSPYKVIGAIDDYYKREAFRSELIRVGSRLADARGIPDEMYNEFIDKFIRVNTELHILRNNGHKPTTSWIKANKNYIGTGEGLFKFADEARDHANYMTFQTELKGAVGNVVDALNSDGFLRILIPFKTSPINMLKMSASQALTPLKKQIYKDIASGGVKRDIALAKLTYSSSVLTGLGFLISSGNVTGSFSQEERTAMSSAGIPEFSYRVGNTWYEYKQLEPIATILGVMTDLYKVQQGFMLRKDDLVDEPSINDFADEIGTILGDIGMSIVNNIVNKTYAKSLSDTMSLMNGDGNLVDYSGNLLSSVVPFSSMATFIGRNFGDGYKKESSEFSEKLLGKYRVFLERDALDAYGRKIDEVKYTPVLTKKSIIDTYENRGALEVARLGINVHKMSKIISYQGIPIKLKPEEYHAMRRSLHEDFKLSDRMNNLVDSNSYKNATDYAKKEILTSLINQIKVGASTKILANPKVSEDLQKGVKKVVKEVTTAEPKKDYNNFVIGGINE